MKKIMTSMIAIFSGFAAYANTVDIDADGNRLNSNPAVAANCTEPILGTYSGSTDFEAKWQANSIPLRWYSDDEQLQVQGEAGTCTYDSGLTVPSSQYQPTKRGYHFRGWTIRTASSGDSGNSGNSGSDNSDSGFLCSLTSSSGAFIEDTEAVAQYWAKESYRNADFCRVGDSLGNGYTSYHTPNLCSTSPFDSFSMNEWKVELGNNNGTISGIANCNSDMPVGDGALMDTIWEQVEAGTITEEEALIMRQPAGTYTATNNGQICWCKVTSYTPNGGNTCDVSASSAWAFYHEFNSASNCASSCTEYCAAYVSEDPSFRRALFVVTE